MMNLLLVITLALLPLEVASYVINNGTCRCFPGDPCWPTQHEWYAFNDTVNGQLIKTVPLGSPCHAPDYNEILCEELKSEWISSSIQ
jgi:hypothetical protein